MTICRAPQEMGSVYLSLGTHFPSPSIALIRWLSVNPFRRRFTISSYEIGFFRAMRSVYGISCALANVMNKIRSGIYVEQPGVTANGLLYSTLSILLGDHSMQQQLAPALLYQTLVQNRRIPLKLANSSKASTLLQKQTCPNY